MTTMNSEAAARSSTNPIRSLTLGPRVYVLSLLSAMLISAGLLGLALATSNQWFGVYCTFIAFPAGSVALLGVVFNSLQYVTSRQHQWKWLLISSAVFLLFFASALYVVFAFPFRDRC